MVAVVGTVVMCTRGRCVLTDARECAGVRHQLAEHPPGAMCEEARVAAGAAAERVSVKK